MSAEKPQRHEKKAEPLAAGKLPAWVAKGVAHEQAEAKRRDEAKRAKRERAEKGGKE